MGGLEEADRAAFGYGAAIKAMFPIVSEPVESQDRD